MKVLVHLVYDCFRTLDIYFCRGKVDVNINLEAKTVERRGCDSGKAITSRLKHAHLQWKYLIYEIYFLVIEREDCSHYLFCTKAGMIVKMDYLLPRQDL